MCDCMKRINDAMAEYNTVVKIPIFGPQRPFIETEKLDSSKRGKPKGLFASHCPFCGEAYPKDDNNWPYKKVGEPDGDTAG